MRILPFLAAVLATLAFAGTASASCLRQTPAQQRAAADVIFDGVALDGRTATGVQRFRVGRYLKGRGPTTARVATGVTPTSVTSVSIVVKRGERWRIYGIRRPSGVFETNVCLGSRRLSR